MVMTPEEYFAGQSLEEPQEAAGPLSAAERAFVQKYLGGDALAGLPVAQPEAPSSGLGMAARAAATTADRDLRGLMAGGGQVQMVSFFVRGQIYLLPVAVIVEVLRYMPVTRVPKAPPYMAGVINLRGKVTPLLHLDILLDGGRATQYTKQSCIIICDARDMQLGLIFDKLHTMHAVACDKISLNVETYLGAGAELLSGMADIANHLHAIIDPALIVSKLLDA